MFILLLFFTLRDNPTVSCDILQSRVDTVLIEGVDPVGW